MLVLLIVMLSFFWVILGLAELSKYYHNHHRPH